MDDFDFDENEEQNIEQDNNSAVDRAIDAKNRAKDVQDKYQNAKDNIDKAKKFRDGVREGTTDKAAKGATKTAAKEGTKTAAKEGTKTAAKEGTKTAAKEATKTAAKEATKVAAKEGAKAGAKGALAASGAVTAGAGTAAAAAIEAADRLNQVRKKASEKIDNVIMQTTGLNLKGKKKFIIILVIFLLYFIITNTGFMFLASEQTYDDLYGIIKKRQVRYAESGKTFKSILLMTNAEVNEILTRDYLESGQKVSDSKYSEYDLCYRTYLAHIYNEEYDNFIPSDSNDPDSTYAEKIKIIEKYLKASRSNFNKIKWILNGGTGGVEIKKYDLKDNLVGVSISGVAAALLNETNNYLSMPNLDKYKSSPSSTADEMKSMYISMVEKYLQPWVVPYALNVASQNNDFGKSVLEDMYDPITVTLYELDRLTRTTITYYYLETTVQIDHYTEEEYDCETTPSGGRSCSTRWVYTNTTYKDSTTATTWTDSSSERYSVSLKTDGGGYIRAGIKSGPDVDRDQKPYRHVPKLTSAEAFYEVLIAKYAIKPINEANPPVETSTTLDSDGKETIIDLFDETLTSISTESKPYKVSYIGEENETYPRKSKSKKEEIKKKYVGSTTEDPKIQGYSYDQLSFGYTQIEKYYNMAAGGGVIGSSSGSLTNIPAGGFAWPVPAILTSGVTIDSEISSPFGQRIHPITGVPSFHPAIDIVHGGLGNPGSTKGVSYGPDIVAAQSGTAYIKHNPGGYGDNYVVIDHKNGYCTLYGHLFSISITDGQEVTQGQTIGVMGTEGSSTGVHLHFGIYQSDSVDSLSNDKAIDPKSVYNTDGTSVGGVTNTGTTVVASTSNQPVMDQMCAKAIDMAENVRNIDYFFGGSVRSTIEELILPDWQTDCSGFVSSMYKAYLGIDVGRGTDAMNSKGQSGYSESGWTAEYHDWSGDVSELLPGDMLIRSSNHVGLYVGNGKQVDNGSGKGPNHKDATVSNYDHYVRYTNPNVVSTTATTNTPGTPSTSTSTAKKISRVEWYLDFQPAKNDTGGASGTSGGSTGTVGSWTVADIDNAAAQIEGDSGSWDLLSLIILEEGGVFTYDCSADGTQYKVENDGAGFPTLGPGICIKYNIERLQDHGVSDPESLSYSTPDYVDKEIIIAVFNEEMGYFIDMVDKMLADNGITVESYQRDALISHAFNSGNVSGFASAYKAANGDAQAVSNYFYGSGSAAGVEKRKSAEAELYATGTYPHSVY